MTALENIIKEEVRRHGPMHIADYMRLCLSHPEHGYYMTRDPFGQDGDFITAPEISQMFGELIGAWIADSWMRLESPNPFILMECGPGRGTLMADALRATKNVDGFHDAVQVHLLENSPVLQGLQKERLQDYGAVWHSEPESIPSDSPLIIIGNEFLDALPTRQLVFTDTGWQEKVVDLDINDTLRLCGNPAKDGVEKLIPSLLIPPKIGDHLEVSLEQKEFMDRFIKIVLKQKGIMLFVDYGFNKPVAGDTLQGVRQHSFSDILDRPGETDITTHVNFADLANFAMENKMTVHGPVSQGEFLTRLGIEIRASKLTQNATDDQRVNIEAALKRLVGRDTKAHEMGDLFKVIAFSSDPDIELAGF